MDPFNAFCRTNMFVLQRSSGEEMFFFSPSQTIPSQKRNISGRINCNFLLILSSIAMLKIIRNNVYIILRSIESVGRTSL